MYCGPLAIASITGVKMSEVYETIGKFSRDLEDPTKITGMSTLHIISCIQDLGFKSLEGIQYTNMLLSEFDSNFNNSPDDFLISVAEHCMYYSKGKIFDTFTPRPLLVSNYVELFGEQTLKSYTSFVKR